MDNTNLRQQYQLKEESLNLKKEVSYYLFFWPWFVGAIIITLTTAFVQLRYADRIYETNAQVQIKKSDSNPASFLTGGAELFGDQVNVENEIAVINSQYILSQVVERLDLQTSIYVKGRFNNSLQNNKAVPFTIQYKKSNPYRSWQLEVANSKVIISADTLSYTIKKDEILDNDFFYFQPKNSLFLKESTYQITYTSLNKAVIQLRNKLKITTGSEGGEVINLKINGNNKQLNEAILNTLIQSISEDQVSDKREISNVSIAFIDQRLEGLRQSIDTISTNTINYKINNEVFEPEIQTTNALSNISQGQQEAFSLSIQLEIAKPLLKQLRAQSNFEILPTNVGIDNESVKELITAYNTVVTQRNNLLVTAAEQNPMVIKLSRQLQQSKLTIVSGVNQYIEGLEISLKNLQQRENQSRGLVASLPNKENTLRGYARNFKIAEELYVFLLQRKEEASINYISALANLKVLSYGVSNEGPIAIKGKSIYIGALLLGALIPFGILFIMKLLDTRINTREDLEKGLKGISILGEIPFDENLTTDVKDSRGITAESIRVLRSSLSFLLKKETNNVITVTSTIQGEGKSFVAYNLAASYGALGKKVILLGADLRNPKLHSRIGIKKEGPGLSNYLSDESFKDIDDLIIKKKGDQEVDYLLSGVIPPNPSELLMSLRMKNLLELLKERYDIILIDSAPLLLVSDTSALLPLSDLVVYVARAQYSDKDIFPFIQDLLNEPNVPAFGMVLNGIISKPNSGYKFGYRYRYSSSYNYNYGYGYGYGYGSEE